jgi:putative acyl-CoA dehydrogenase
VCKRVSAVVVEALECHGGNGFIEDNLMARLYREAPLNGIWEGTGNVICLDVLRSMQREPTRPSR